MTELYWSLNVWSIGDAMLEALTGPLKVEKDYFKKWLSTAILQFFSTSALLPAVIPWLLLTPTMHSCRGSWRYQFDHDSCSGCHYILWPWTSFRSRDGQWRLPIETDKNNLIVDARWYYQWCHPVDHSPVGGEASRRRHKWPPLLNAILYSPKNLRRCWLQPSTAAKRLTEGQMAPQFWAQDFLMQRQHEMKGWWNLISNVKFTYTWIFCSFCP